MKTPFENLPEDKDTHVLISSMTKFGERDVLVQDWIWDGVQAQSLIFIKDQIKNLSETELLAEANKYIKIEGSHTLSDKSEYMFINHKFEVTK